MKLLRTATVLALMAGTFVTTLDVSPASAVTLMDLIRGGKKARASEQRSSLPGVETSTTSQPQVQQPVQKVSTPRVTGPKYYTYKAEGLRRVATSGLLDRLTTGSVAVAAATPALAGSQAQTAPAAQSADIRVMAPGEVAKAVEAFYASQPGMLWVDASGPTARADAALKVLAAADSVGLDPLDYAVARPTETADPSLRAQEMAQFELRLTVAALTFVQDTVRGRIDPNKISGYHDFKRKSVNLDGVLKVLALSHDPAAYIASKTPSGPQFTALTRELARLITEGDQEKRVEIAPGTLLKPGESHPELPNVVAAMREKASDTLKVDHSLVLASYAGTSDYTPELVDFVKAFQAENNLKPDGIVGKASLRVLTGGDSHADRIGKVKIALEQARWLPADLGDRYVFINQPEFMAHYAEGGREKFAMRVVVGSKANQTYFFQDEIQTVEVNPYWGVPQSIIINEMLPKLRNDPNYLDRLGYQVEVGGKSVPSSSVNWYGSTASVAVRQPPSSDNALGELKILFPNEHAIYMHDTPSKSFFKKDMRALSHGCVRLSEPRKMAAAVLGVTEEDIGQQIAGGQNKALPVKSNIPVYVSYFTAWPDKDGVVRYFDDVYDRDTFMRRAIDATRAARTVEG